MRAKQTIAEKAATRIKKTESQARSRANKSVDETTRESLANATAMVSRGHRQGHAFACMCVGCAYLVSACAVFLVIPHPNDCGSCGVAFA